MEQLKSLALKILDISSTSMEIFDGSSDDSCSSLCTNLLHSTPIKQLNQAALLLLVTSDSELEIEVFDESTTSGEY